MNENNNILDHLKSRPVQTPDASYFEQLANHAIGQQNKAKVIPLYKRPSVWLASAAAIFLATLMIINLGEQPTKQDVLLSMNDLQQDEIFMYVDENIDEFDTEMICEVIHEDSLEVTDLIENDITGTPVDIEAVEVSSELNFDDIDVNDILEYLNDEGIDPDELNDDTDYLNL